MPDHSDPANTPRILIVEDESVLAERVVRSLEALGYEVSATVSSAEEAFRKVAESKPSLILADIRLERDLVGIQTADPERIRFAVPIVYLTEFSEAEVLARAKERGPCGYVGKQFGLFELRSAVEAALYKHEADKKVDELGRTIRTYGVNQDITDRKTVEEALRRSEERFRSLIEQAPDAIFVHDHEGKILRVNELACSSLGYTQGPVLVMANQCRFQE